MTGMQIPEGFAPFTFDSPFVKLIGPLYLREDERGIALGLQVREDHLNIAGILHGGVAATVADVVLGRNVHAAGGGAGMVTASLTVDFVASARAGDWVEATASVVRSGRRAAFANALLTVGGRPIAQANGVFMVVRPAPGPR